MRPHARHQKPLREHDEGDHDLTVLAMELTAALEDVLLAVCRFQSALPRHAFRRTERTACTGRTPASAVPDTAPEACAVREPCPNGLSRREKEVLALLATGRSTRQSAQTLYVSPRTVQRHIANLYLKIGAHSRAEATAYAIDHDLR